MNKKEMAEAKLLEIIDKLGLVREVQHHRYWFNGKDKNGNITKMPDAVLTNFDIGTHSSAIIGKTEVFLFNKKDYVEYKKNKVPYKERTTVAYGVANCSANDSFDKTVGRIIATSRAIKNYKPIAFNDVRTSKD